jgi:hypothetical protein
LELVQDALEDSHMQMDRLIDLYLTSEFTKEKLSKHRAKLEEQIRDLEAEQSELEHQLEDDIITEDEVETLKALGRKIREGLEEADNDFETRRELIDLLDVTVTLGIENGEKVIEAECRLGAQAVSIESRNTSSSAPGRTWPKKKYSTPRAKLPARDDGKKARAGRLIVRAAQTRFWLPSKNS